MNKSVKIIPEAMIERRIHVIRGHNVMLDSDLAALYKVTTAALNQAMGRNKDRFPEDFAFQLTSEEFQFLISQNVISSSGHGGRRKIPWVFTEHGILMLSSVLRSKQAARVNIAIMRTFVRMREAMASHKELALRIDEIEQKYDARFKAVFDAIRSLMEPPPVPQEKPIGYIHHGDNDAEQR
ncbi:MAG: ORF6N domain-containing protein [Hyphomicrobiales bacterium]|nr:ORF6N domain-containing protein [Hyphomicrobiales bacterium]